MGLFNSLIALLAIKILFLKVNAISLDYDHPSSQLELKKVVKIFNNSRCNESRNVSQLVPYNETYYSKPEHAMPGEPYQNKTRLYYKKEFHTELTCCEGYVQSGAMCVPRCPQSCQNGTCKEPDVCTCNTGYRMSSNGSCVSQCTNNCVNGTCVDGVCNCNEGYLLDSDGFTCRPVCPAECEETHGYCTEPHVCTCPSGYRQRKRFYHVFKFMCEPVCDRKCTDGLCVAPNICKCADGYEKDENDSFTCRPKCDDPCAFGTCVSPGYCQCKPGYIKTYHTANDTIVSIACEPQCFPSCKMGKCVAPYTCGCNEGYRLRNNSKDICEPICENDMCGGGICVAPGKCLHGNPTVWKSNTSVVLSNSTQSKPICTIPCGPNGECTSPNECTCFEGYRSHAQLIITELHENFSKTPFPELSEKHICQPVCNFKCYNGKCTAPNVCTCDPGYYPRWLEDSDFESYHFCYRLNGPPCNALSCGDNGTCHESGICVCDDGYRKDTAGACIPICNRGCLDGMCTEPDYCACREGYALQNNKFEENVCKAICERGCENGECVSPNECICNNGFIPNIDHHSRPECIPVCTRNCSGHGDCIISTDRDHYRCECHFGWTGLDCDHPSLCVIKMAYEKVKKRGLVHFANSTIKRAYEDAPYCSQCYDSLDNKTVCYVMENYEHNLTVSCLLNTDLPCYAMSRYDASSNVTIIVWPFVILAVLLVIGLTVAAYFIYRRHQRKKLATGTSTNFFVRESPATEILLPDI